MGKNKNNEFSDPSAVPVAEELKITIALALKKLTMTENKKELEFPSSLTATERKYIHLVSQQYGFMSKSRGKGSMRYLTVYKKEGSTIMRKEPILHLSEGSRSTILGLLQRCPVGNKERQDLLPGTEKDRLMNPELRDLNLARSLGRLTPGPPQVPPLGNHNEITAEARKLPVWNMKEQLLTAINHNQVILVRGETGSGKTTQVPQVILQEANKLNRPCRIFCTQPRRISALSIAERVSAERGEKVGYTVGYQIRMEAKLSPKTLLTFCTTGVLLRTLMGGESALSTVTHVLVDEVHERDRFADFLLTVLRDCLPKFRHLKLILMSANLDANLYAKYFHNCPVVDIPGRTYPVKAYFLEDTLKYISYTTPKMQNYLKQLQVKEKGLDEAREWTRNILKNLKLAPNTSEAKATKETADVQESTNKSNESDTNKASGNSLNRQEMDSCIEKAFTTGEDEYFNQIMYLIMSENVSPDYQHSSTWASPLMVAAGRGRVDILEQLLALGATINLKAANEWTAIDWAESTKQQEALDFLKSYSAYEGIDLNDKLNTRTSATVSSEDKVMIEAYNLSLGSKSVDTDLIFTLCLKIHQSQPPGGILVFLPGYEDIVTIRDNIISEDKQFSQAGKYILFCLHSCMQSSDQKRVFRSSPTGVRKIVLATNIAETSITINDIIYVIDSGKVKEITFDALCGISCLRPVWISQASAIQRRGRAGRCQPGICYHLFSKSTYSLFQEHQTPEILRSPLQDLCLHTKLLAMPNMLIADFLARAPEPPAFIAVKNAVHLLKSMDALDSWEDVTELGHHLLDLPLPPNLGKMVIVSTILKCLDPILTIAASLAYRDPFVLPNQPSEKNTARNVRKKFASGTFSDHMVFLKAFQAWQKSYSEQWQRRWCDRHFVSGATMEMIMGMRAQVLAQLRSSGFVRARGPGDIRDVNTNSDNWSVVKAALLSGVYPNLIRVDRELKQLRTEKESKVRLHSSSALLDFKVDSSKDLKAKSLTQIHKNVVSSLPSDWLVYDEMVRIGTVAHVKTVTLVSPLAVLLMAGPMRLPLDALSEPSNRGAGRGGGGGDISSDSESEHRPEGMNSFLKIDCWVQFLGSQTNCSLALQLRHKLHGLILRRLRAPNKPYMQGDDDIVRVLAAVLSQEENNLGLQQPAGVGQRPRAVSSNSFNLDSNFTPSSSMTNGDISGNQRMNDGSFPSPQILQPNSPSSVMYCNTSSDNTSTKGLINSDMVPPNNVTIVPQSLSSGNAGASNVNFTNVPIMQHSRIPNGGKTRYFIMRVNSYKQIQISQNRNLWVFQNDTERKVSQAAQNSVVILIFALMKGNQFYGFARLVGPDLEAKCPEMINFGPANCSLYKVEWIKKWNIYFHQTKHLLNPYTDNLQVHMCRDGQEVESGVGEQLIKVWEKTGGGANAGGFGGMNDTAPPQQRMPFFPHGPPNPFAGPPVPFPQHFARGPFRNFGNPSNDWYGGNNFRGGAMPGYRGGYRR